MSIVRSQAVTTYKRQVSQLPIPQTIITAIEQAVPDNISKIIKIALGATGSISTVKGILEQQLPDIVAKYPGSIITVEQTLTPGAFPPTPSGYTQLYSKGSIRILWRPAKVMVGEIIERFMGRIMPGLIIGGLVGIIFGVTLARFAQPRRRE